MDFERWQRTTGSEALCLSGPAKCRISDASSYIVDLVKERPSRTQHLVLYFFCSTAPAKAPIAATFASTIIHQLASYIPQLIGKVISVFLRTLLDTTLGGEPRSDPGRPHFKIYESAEATVKEILKTPSSGYWGALREVLDIERELELSLIIDGLDEVEHREDNFIQELCAFVEHLRKRPSTTRVLLTSQSQTGIKEILSQLPVIEHDRERKGSISLISSQGEQGS